MTTYFYLGSLTTKLYVSSLDVNQNGFALTNNMTKALRFDVGESKRIISFLQDQTGLVFTMIPC